MTRCKSLVITIKVIFAQLLSVIVNEIGLIARICCMYIVHGAAW